MWELLGLLSAHHHDGKRILGLQRSHRWEHSRQRELWESHFFRRTPSPSHLMFRIHPPLWYKLVDEHFLKEDTRSNYTSCLSISISIDIQGYFKSLKMGFVYHPVFHIFRQAAGDRVLHRGRLTIYYEWIGSALPSFAVAFWGIDPDEYLGSLWNPEYHCPASLSWSISWKDSQRADLLHESKSCNCSARQNRPPGDSPASATKAVDTPPRSGLVCLLPRCTWYHKQHQSR